MILLHSRVRQTGTLRQQFWQCYDAVNAADLQEHLRAWSQKIAAVMQILTLCQNRSIGRFKVLVPDLTASHLVHPAGAFGRMESNTVALMKILDSLEKQERMVKTMLEDRKRQLKGSGAKANPGMAQLTASTAQVENRLPGQAVQLLAAFIS